MLPPATAALRRAATRQTYSRCVWMAARCAAPRAVPGTPLSPQPLLLPHCATDFAVASCRALHAYCPLMSKTKDRGKDKKGKKHVAVDESEMAEVIDVASYKEKLEHAVQEMKRVYAEQVSLRTATGSLHSLKVTLEGDTYPLNEVAQITYKNPQLIIVNCSAFPQATQDIMKTLLQSGMNLNPQQEGTTIYVPLPRVTMEHREQLSKNAKIFFNRCKDTIRDLRNNYVAEVKKGDKTHPADVLFSVEQQVHALSEHYAAVAEEVLKAKQADLMNVK